MSAVEEKYVGQGVKASFQGVGQAIKSTATRIGGLGSGFVTHVQDAANYMWTIIRTHPAFAGVASTGKGSIEPAAATTHPQIATNVQFRDISNGSDFASPGLNEYDMHTGSGSNEYFNFTIQQLGGTNSDGAIAYAISQGNQCLTMSGDQALLATCNPFSNSAQWWYADGTELMSGDGRCITEDPGLGRRYLVPCDGLNYFDNVTHKDDQFLISSTGGTLIPDTIAHWQADWKEYATQT
jgi:hypothetical protein